MCFGLIYLVDFIVYIYSKLMQVIYRECLILSVFRFRWLLTYLDIQRNVSSFCFDE